jgi:hypothetical protein
MQLVATKLPQMRSCSTGRSHIAAMTEGHKLVTETGNVTSYGKAFSFPGTHSHVLFDTQLRKGNAWIPAKRFAN